MKKEKNILGNSLDAYKEMGIDIKKSNINDFLNNSPLRKLNPDMTDQFPIEEGITVKIGNKTTKFKLDK